MKRYRNMAIAAVFAFGASMAVGGTSVSAAPLQNAGTAGVSFAAGGDAFAGHLQLVHDRRGRGYRDQRRVRPHSNYRQHQRAAPRYEQRRHGQRYRSQRGRYVHRHTDGFYYSAPWWALGAIVGGAIASQGAVAAPHGNVNAHVQWCNQRYRSYNVRTDTFRGYDGRDHRCNSPYR